MLLTGMAMAVLPVIGIVLYAKWLDKKYPEFNQEVFTEEELKKNTTIILKVGRKSITEFRFRHYYDSVTDYPDFIKAIFELVAKNDAAITEFSSYQVFALLNSLLSHWRLVLISVYTLLPKIDKNTTALHLEEGVKTAGIILLVTGAGGALGSVC